MSVSSPVRANTSDGGPSAAISPSRRTTIRSAARSSSDSCSITIRLKPCSRSFLINAKTSALPSGSRSVVGSSSTMTDGRSASTDAIARRCFSPPDSDIGSRCSKPRRPTASSAGQDSAIHLGAIHADLFHRERDFVRDVGREQLRLEILEDHADLRCDVADAKVLERLAGDANCAVEIAVLELRDDAIEAFRQRRFARARRAHHADHLAGVLHEAYRSKRRPVAARDR